MPYRGLILDFAGVMTTPIGRSSQAWCTQAGLPADAWRSTLEDDPVGRALYVELELGRMSQEAWNAGTAAILGVDAENLMGRVHAQVRAVPSMLEVARQARLGGISVALLSNSYGFEPYDPYQATGVWDLFDVHIVSGHEGIAKPDPAIYALTLQRLGLSASECLFVDDHLQNLPPAASLGMATLHATGSDETARVIAEQLSLPRPGHGPQSQCSGNPQPYTV
ncbi:HAD family phosphatase [Kitasatospora sp. NPDC048540]|uniref:HAD family hydrolase n=1 Tax=Kitasatospora sp. NPDC048540 TaxID=3155634 RepID=UPI0033F97D75